jgi:lysophospholipase L1-like esterase
MKRYLSWLLTVILIVTNIYTAIKLLNYREKLFRPPLIEHVYSNIANEMTFENPIVFTGDSMVHRMNWNYIFQNLTKNNDNANNAYTPVIFNRGIGGNKSDQLLRRFESNILSLNPIAVFIEIGTNDLIRVNRTNHESLEKYVLSNYYKIINMAMSHDDKLKIFIIPILPVLNNKLRNLSAIRINNELEIFSSKNNRIHLVDCFNLFYDKDANAAKAEYMIGPQTAHLNDVGYRKWAEVLLEYVMTLK